MVISILLNMPAKGPLARANNPAFMPGNSSITINITQSGNGYYVSNITSISPFIVTLNGSAFRGYVSYITLGSTGLVLNGSVYALHAGSPVLVYSRPGIDFYAELVNASYYSKPSTVGILFYTAPSYTRPILNRTYTFSGVSSAVINVSGTNSSIILRSAKSGSAIIVITNLTNSVETAPANYTALLILRINVTSSANVTESVSFRYPCGILPGAVVPYKLESNGTWSKIAYTSNSTGCSIGLDVPPDPVIGMFERSNYLPTTSSISSTILPTTSVISAPTTIGQSSLSETRDVEATSVVVIVIIVAVIAYYASAARRKPDGQKEK
ncbi:MAG: hypothetical protein KGI06_05700 [Candidatus Micrarchaeota archaeon]|nr:hypothetical protein [Candidatus Micrarchaeota archaeon]